MIDNTAYLELCIDLYTVSTEPHASPLLPHAASFCGGLIGFFWPHSQVSKQIQQPYHDMLFMQILP